MFHAVSVLGSIPPSFNFPSQPRPCAACPKLIERVAVYCKTCFSVSYCSHTCLEEHIEIHQKRCTWEQGRKARHFAVLKYNCKLDLQKHVRPTESNDTLLLNARIFQLVLDIKMNYPDGDLVIQHGYAHVSSEAFLQEFQQRLASLPPDRQEERRKLLYQAQCDFELVILARNWLLHSAMYKNVWDAVKSNIAWCDSVSRSIPSMQSTPIAQRLLAAGNKICELLPLLDDSRDRYLISGFIFKGGSKAVLEAALNKFWAMFDPRIAQARRAKWEKLKPHYEVLLDAYMCIGSKGEWEMTATDPEPSAPMPPCSACEKKIKVINKVCAGCFRASYCCVETQKKDWREHKPFCLAIKARDATLFRQFEFFTLQMQENDFQREIRVRMLDARNKYPDADLYFQKLYGIKFDETVAREFEVRLSKLPPALAEARRRLAVCMQEEYDHYSLLTRAQAIKESMDHQIACLAEKLGSSEAMQKLQACHPIDQDLIKMFILTQANQEVLESHLKFDWATLKPEEAAQREAKWQALAPHFPELLDAIYNLSDMHQATNVP